MTSPVLAHAPQTWRGLLLAEYDALVATGVLDEERVELLEGAMTTMSPHRPLHAHTVTLVMSQLAHRLAPGLALRVQLPLAVPPRSEPEPDVAVVAEEDYSDRHPSTALLVIEVALTSQPTDLRVKPGIYVTAGVTEYWVIDLVERVVHVHRGPGPEGYAEVSTQAAGILRSATGPSLTLDLAAVLPPH